VALLLPEEEDEEDEDECGLMKREGITIFSG